MRAFLGISIKDELKQRIVLLQEKFSDFDIKFVETENLHFNLKFFREIDAKKADQMKAMLSKKLENFKDFEINISGVGTFPKKTYARVVWLGVREGEKDIKMLSEAIDDVCERLGFEKTINFVPHLTIGRARSGRNKEKMIELIEKLENQYIGRMKVEKITLFSSILGASGPKYNKIFSINLNHQE